MESLNEKRYLILYCKTGVVKQVSRVVFAKIVAPVVVIGDNKFRLIGCVSRTDMRKQLVHFYAEGFLDNVKAFKDGIDVLISSVVALGHMKQELDKFTKRNMAVVVKLFLELKDLCDGGFTVSKMINVILSLYVVQDAFVGESFDSMSLMLLGAMLPSKLFDILRRVQTLSHFKVGDDLSGLHAVLIGILEYVEEFVTTLPDILGIKNLAQRALGYFKNGSTHVLIREVDTLLKKFATDSKCLLLASFRGRILAVDEKIKSDVLITEWSNRSLALKKMLADWSRLVKVTMSYGSVARVEPSCFVLEGPPGRLKSVVLNGLLTAMDETVYTHSVKAIHDGKDWHDNYNNEANYVMDDVGQQGKSQWRTIINFVSAVKMPLECADAKLKDSKFFNSKRIFVTTNGFQNLHGLKETDCISDIQALWRRGYVFDFSKAQRQKGFLVGTIDFKFYSLASGCFVNAFPPEVSEKLKRIKSSIELRGDSPRTDLFAWMLTIIRAIDLAKESFAIDNELTISELDLIKQQVDEFMGEGLSSYLPSWKNRSDTSSLTTEWFDTEWVSQGLMSCMSDTLASVTQHLSTMDFKTLVKCVVFIALAVGAALLLAQCVKPRGSFLQPFLGEMKHFKFSVENLHNSVVALVSRVKPVSFIIDDEERCCFALVSGHNLVVPAHIVNDGAITCVTIFGDQQCSNKIVDKEKGEMVFCDNQNDVAVVQLPANFASPFKKMAEYFKGGLEEDHVTYLVNFLGVKTLGTYAGCKFGRTVPYIAQSGRYTNQLLPHYASYDVRGAGLCGSVLYSVQGGIVGMHVAGGDSVTGVSAIWTPLIREKIKTILDADLYILPYADKVSVDKLEGLSVCRLEADVGASVVSKTALGPSPLFGVFPVTREPANLQIYGRCTVKDIAKKSFQNGPILDKEELLFGKAVLSSILDSYGDMTEREVVKGNELLAGLNKTSSNGYKCLKNKSDYIDFEQGEYTQLMRTELSQMELDLESGDFHDWEKLFWTETLKDELRGKEKQGVPRSFRIGTIHQQVLTKKYFGKMVEGIVANRKLNQVMVGVNPNSDWTWIYDQLVTSKGVFAGDIKNWDGSMSPQVQRAVVDVLMTFYKGNHPGAAGKILDLLVHSLVVVQDDLFLTTHSMPSGSFLTAIVNSLVNRFYTAMWYYRNIKKKRKPTIGGFNDSVVDFVYGDDKLNAIRKDEDVLNALTMKEFFDSIGLGFTTSTKAEIKVPFEDIADVTFLKRSFRYHNILGRVMCPLDLRTLFSFLSYVSYEKDVAAVMQDKVNCFQREIYLHPERETLLRELCSRLKDREYSFVKLTPQYLKQLYEDPDYNPDEFRLGVKDILV